MLIHPGKWQGQLPVADLAIAGHDVLAVSLVSLAPTGGGAAIDIEVRATLAALLAALQQQGIIS